MRCCEIKYLGGWDRLRGAAVESGRRRADPARAARQPRGSGDRRRGDRRPRRFARRSKRRPPQRRLPALLRSSREHERLAGGRDAPYTRAHARARRRPRRAPRSLGDAHARHDDEPLSVAELAGTIRRWIEGQTFSPRTGHGGVDAARRSGGRLRGPRRAAPRRSGRDRLARSRRAAASSIPRRCSRSLAGRAKPIGWRAARARSTICCGCRARASRCRPSRSRTTRSSRRRRSWKISSTAGWRSSAGRRRSRPARVRARGARETPFRSGDVNGDAADWLALAASRDAVRRRRRFTVPPARTRPQRLRGQPRRALSRMPVQVLRDATSCGSTRSATRSRA